MSDEIRAISELLEELRALSLTYAGDNVKVQAYGARLFKLKRESEKRADMKASFSTSIGSLSSRHSSSSEPTSDKHSKPNIRLPKLELTDEDRLNWLHGIADASLKGCAAVVYIRTFYTDTSVSTALIMSKTKVAPIQVQTVP